MKICVAIASHQRQKPLLAVLRCMPKDWDVVIVLSPGEKTEPYLKRTNTHVFHYANQPLGKKWQFAVDRAKDLAPDFLIITGSDDAIRSTTAAVEKAMHGRDFMGLRSFVAYDGTDHYRCTYRINVRMPIGGGRIYRKSLLEKFRWQLFDVTRDRWLDEKGWFNASRNSDPARVGQVNEIPGFEIIALKGDWPCKNSLQKYISGRNLDVVKLPAVRTNLPYRW